MLTSPQIEEFERSGLVRLRAAFDRAAIAAITDRVWEFLAFHRGIQRDDPSTWGVYAPWDGLKTLKREAWFRALRSPVLEAAIDGLLGAGSWTRPRHWGGFLVNFPNCAPAAWTIPASGWHVDFHYTHEPGTPFGLRVFTFLDEVRPRAGGTLIVRGSHRLVERFVAGMTAEQRAIGYAKLRERFNASDPWFAELTNGDPSDPGRVGRFLDRPHEIDGVPLRVDQLCGEPGDVVITHPWILHAIAPNAGDQPRLMLGKVIYAEQPSAV